MNEYVVFGTVFIGVLAFSAVFISIFTSAINGKREQANDASAVRDPVSHFIDPEDLQKIRYSAALVICILGVAVIVFTGFVWGLLIVAALVCLGYYIPWWIIQRKVRNRNREFEMGMLDFTVLISNTLRAGIALPSAIEMATQTIGGPIREEFTIVLREHRLGMDLAECIDRMTKRVDSENLQLFAATVCVSIRTGGSMSEVLERVVATIRQRVSFQDKLKSRVAQSEFEALAVSLMPVVGFFVLYAVDPGLMMPVLKTTVGWCAIFIVIILETIGFLMLKHVTRVDF